MPRWNIAKKLNPAKKAWRSFRTKIRPTLQSFLISFASFLSSKLRFISKPTLKTRHNNHFHRNPRYFTNHQKGRPSFATIRIDKLFEQRDGANVKSKSSKNDVAGTSQSNIDLERHVTMYGIEEAWKAAVASSPQLRCVDERAEEFIDKVRRDMKLQKEKSILEFQEMLARGC